MVSKLLGDRPLAPTHRPPPGRSGDPAAAGTDARITAEIPAYSRQGLFAGVDVSEACCGPTRTPT
jgi:hypothetical protein